MTDRAAARRQRIWQLGAVSVVVAIVTAIAIAVGTGHGPPHLRPSHPVPGADRTSALFAGIPQAGDTLGDRRAPVTLVEFGDLQCPICAQFARDALPAVVSRYVRPGRLQLVFHSEDFIGADSRRAAQMAMALGEQGHLWQFVDLLYRNQDVENTGYVTDGYLTALAEAIPGIDAKRALGDRTSPAVAALLARERQEAARAHVSTTPSFLLGRTGVRLHPFEPDGLDPGSFSGPLNRVLAGRSP